VDRSHLQRDNPHVVIGGQNYFLSYDGYLMPARKNQEPPDLRYFKPGAEVTAARGPTRRTGGAARRATR